MAKYQIRYGLGGGFGGAGEWEDCEAEIHHEAEDMAYEAACEVYETYDGLYGLQSTYDIQEKNPDWDTESVEEEWREQRESWLEYEVREVK